ncbi:MAG: DUF882 domain-containing protein [Rhodospirillaceae bacterium]
MQNTDDHAESFSHDRRRLLRLALSCLAAGGSSMMIPGSAEAGLIEMLGGRILSFVNVHTSERLSVPFATGGSVVPGAMTSVRKLLHDHHDGSAHDIDPKLLDVLFSIMRLVGGGSVINVLSGYRSPRTNSMLRMSYDGVAANSFHMYGKAIDFWVPGVPIDSLHRAAMSVHGGGVGYYPGRGFIHVDVGPVRHWGSGGSGGWAPRYAPGSGDGAGGLPRVITINGHKIRLTPIQARNLERHRRALNWEHGHRRRP